MTRPPVLLARDPQSGLLLDAKAQPLELNPALRTLLGADPLAALSCCLPSNHLHLVRTCLDPRRAIEGVEAQFGERILLWTCIPDPPGERVLARCRSTRRTITGGIPWSRWSMWWTTTGDARLDRLAARIGGLL